MRVLGTVWGYVLFVWTKIWNRSWWVRRKLSNWDAIIFFTRNVSICGSKLRIIVLSGVIHDCSLVLYILKHSYQKTSIIIDLWGIIPRVLRAHPYREINIYPCVLNPLHSRIHTCIKRSWSRQMRRRWWWWPISWICISKISNNIFRSTSFWHRQVEHDVEVSLQGEYPFAFALYQLEQRWVQLRRGNQFNDPGKDRKWGSFIMKITRLHWETKSKLEVDVFSVLVKLKCGI